MAPTYIAFIECVFDSVKSTKWHTRSGFPFDDPRTVREIKRAIADDAKMSLVDIKNDRRYFSFKQKAEVQIVNNVVVFDSDWAEELAIDEDVQFPKTKKMTD